MIASTSSTYAQLAGFRHLIGTPWEINYELLCKYGDESPTRPCGMELCQINLWVGVSIPLRDVVLRKSDADERGVSPNTLDSVCPFGV